MPVVVVLPVVTTCRRASSYAFALVASPWAVAALAPSIAFVCVCLAASAAAAALDAAALASSAACVSVCLAAAAAAALASCSAFILALCASIAASCACLAASASAFPFAAVAANAARRASSAALISACLAADTLLVVVPPVENFFTYPPLRIFGVKAVTTFPYFCCAATSDSRNLSNIFIGPLYPNLRATISF